MALNTKKRCWVDTSRERYTVLTVQPRIADIKTGEQKLTKQGVPVFSFDVFAVDKETGESSVMTVNVPSAQPPVVPLMTEVQINGLAAFMWAMNNGNAGLSFSADAISVLPSISSAVRNGGESK